MAAYEQPGLQDELGHDAERRARCCCCPLHLCPIPPPPDSAPVSEHHIETFSFQEVPLSAQRKNQKWAGSSRTTGPKKTSMTTYSNWGSLGTRVWGRATCWTASPQRIQPREQEHHWRRDCHLSIQGNSKTIEAQIWHNAQPRVPTQGNKVSKPLTEKSCGG